MSDQSTAQASRATLTSCSLANMLAYGSGECASSLVINSVFAFGMLYYTKALMLDPFWAGIAIALAVFWEGIAEPVMGYISDNTRSRWGRRHPYMIFGGLLMSACTYMIWTVPDGFKGNQLMVFWYLVVVNIFLRTGLTIFSIPYMALGFEMCSDYQGRSQIQSIRLIYNMLANLAGPALAWSIFFQDRVGIRGTTMAENYRHMGIVFALATAFFVVLVVVLTRRRREDSRGARKILDGSWFRRFWLEMQQFLLDPNLRWIVIFVIVNYLGAVWVSSLQVFVYEDFMIFSADEKTLAHSSTMVGVVIGSFVSVRLVKRFDKKVTVILGGLVSVAGNCILSLLFLTGLVSPGTVWDVGGISFPLATSLFVAFHATYWLGIGIELPVATAMVADVSEIHFLQTGDRKEGGYSSIISMAIRVAISIGLMTSGYCLNFIGYKTTPDAAVTSHNPEMVWRLGFVTFVAGAFMCSLAILAIRRYPVTQHTMEELRAAKGIVQVNYDEAATK